MKNRLLEGIQYRELKPEFPSWKYTEDQRYTEWRDVPDNGKGVVFASYAQFRTKPEYIYLVNGLRYDTSKDALEAIELKLHNGALDVRVTKEELAKVSFGNLMQERHVQYSSGANWYDVNPSSRGDFGHRVQFRIRPEVYWTLQFGDGRKTRTFTDKAEMTAVVKELADKGDFNFAATEHVKKENCEW